MMIPKRILATVVLPVIGLSHAALSFQTTGWAQRQTAASVKLAMAKESEESYQNKVAELFSNFLPGKSEDDDPLEGIDFGAPKIIKKGSLEALAEALDSELYQAEWFVTGKVNPIYFADSFQFRDPDVSVNGIEEYARGVCKIFDQEVSRAQIISTVVNTTVPNTITCTWRLSGKVNLGPGLTIKPYIVYTDFTVDPATGLVVFQEDRFSIPGWDIFLSSFFPFLIGQVTTPPAPPVEPRPIKMIVAETRQEKASWWPF